MALRALARVNLAAIERNVIALRARLAGDAQLCAVVKADASGHGAVPVARAALAGGAGSLAVATVNEAAELRAAGITAPVLVMGAISADELPVALAAGAEVVAWTEHFVRAVAASAPGSSPVGVHVKLDSGMGRLGTRQAAEALSVAELVTASGPRVQLVGAMTHFATADGDQEFVAAQLAAFSPFAAELQRRLGRVRVHAANSAATLRQPAAHFDMVRCGIALYGCDPMNEDPARQGLEPALELSSYVAAVKRAEPGESAGYGRRFVAARPTWIATLPIGYADGVRRGLSNNCDVLIGGRRYPLVGTVSMDNLTLDLGPDPPAPGVGVGATAILIGASGDERLTVEAMANRLGTINHEVLCGISARVPRQYHRDGVSGVMSDPLAAVAGLTAEAWLVGGAVRDRVLGRDTADFDVAMAGPVAPAAQAVGRTAGGFAFELSEAFGAWRVVAHDRTWQLDLLPLDGATIEEDLSRRDLTINAIAAPLAAEGYVDPFGGLEDLRRRRLRAVTPAAFQRDALRILRLARLACELSFDVDPETLALASAGAPALDAVAPERVFAEFKRVVCAPAALDGLALMDRTGATGVVLPELAALHGVEQSRFHHLDVADHTRAVLAEAITLEQEPERLAGPDAGALREYLNAPLANELTRGQALRFGALLHDIAKPQTRSVTSTGRVMFMGHDEAGARLSGAILGRLRASERLREHVAALTRHHLRLGFLVHEMPLTRRAVYDYLHVTAPVAVDVTVLSVADRLATRGDNAGPAIARHLELAGQLIREAMAWVADPPRPPLRGDELVRALGIKPGPVLGDLLAELEAASFSGEVATREEAIERARQLIAPDGSD